MGAAVVGAGLTLGAVRWGGTQPPAVSALSRAGHPVRWAKGEIVLEPFVPDRGALPAADLAAALKAGIREWNAALDGCGLPTLRLARGPVGRIRQDGRSVVLVRTDSWCPEGARGREDCYDQKRAAITHLYPVQSASSPHDGAIDEADIEINAVDFRWSLDGEEPGTSSLRAIVAHELGHVFGLDHSCSPTPKSRPRESGPPLPSCAAPEARPSIMFPDPVEPGRDLVVAPGRNEVATLCALYRNPPPSEARR